MPPTDRELWLLNFYRNSELHGALLMGSSPAAIRNRATHQRHSSLRHGGAPRRATHRSNRRVGRGNRSENRHDTRALFSRRRCPQSSGRSSGFVGDFGKPRVVRLSRALAIGVPAPRGSRGAGKILREEEEHGTGEDAWLDRILRAHPVSQVEASRRKWAEIDRKVAAEIHSQLDSMFPVETNS